MIFKGFLFLFAGRSFFTFGSALAVLEAQKLNLSNFSLLSLLKRTTPALRALVAQEDLGISGFLCPGRVATILGADAFRFLSEEYNLPAVVAGFESGDLLAAIGLLLRQCKDGVPKLENEYTRAVSPGGNSAALAVMEQVFTPCTDLWRGLGTIEESGLRLRDEFSAYDAAKRFDFRPSLQDAPSPCRCGDLICGRIRPQQCPLFGTFCTPEDPVGPCMVSSEGACAAAYHYGRDL